MTRYLSGIQPSSKPHIGNYFGAISQHVKASKIKDEAIESYFFIADYHALTSIKSADELRRNVHDVAASYLALGLDPNHSVFWRQSDVPQVTELAWLLMTCTGMGLLERAVSYKDKVAKGLNANVGLFTYPILQAADILMFDGDIVQVGKDQIQHIEITQDVAGHFNHRFGVPDCLKKPKWQLSETPNVPGTDGAKMSSSYGNYIWIFEEGKALKKAVNKIMTDSRAPSEAKNPDELVVYQILDIFLNPDEKESWRKRISEGGETAPGYGDLKKEIMSKMDQQFGDAREKYHGYMTNPGMISELNDILDQGARKAQETGKNVLARCYDACGMDSAKKRLL